jgi:hypothetical protein
VADQVSAAGTRPHRLQESGILAQGPQRVTAEHSIKIVEPHSINTLKLPHLSPGFILTNQPPNIRGESKR